MSLVAKIEQLFAESGDAALHGLKAIAAEVEKLTGGGLTAADLEAKIKAEVASVVNPFLLQLQQAFEGRVKELEDGLATVAAATQQIATSLPPVAAPSAGTGPTAQPAELATSQAPALQPSAATAAAIAAEVAGNQPSSLPGGQAQPAAAPPAAAAPNQAPVA